MDSRPNNVSRTRRILDVLDSLVGKVVHTSNLDETPNTSTNDMQSTRKWLHDISVGRSPGPPRSTLRTPSRLYSIVTNVRDKPYWKRPTEMAAAAASKRKEVSFEADSEPGDSDVSVIPKNSDGPKKHHSIIKSLTGRNVAPSIKSNIFNADIVDLEDDVSTEQTKNALESVQLPPNFGKNIESGFVSKPKLFSFTKPIVRGPVAVEEDMEEEEESSSEEISDVEEEEEKAEKNVEVISSKALNSETSSSDTSPERRQPDASVSDVRQVSNIAPIVPAAISAPIPIASQSDDSWECSTCMVYNKAADDKCVACTTPKNPPSVSTTTTGATWECPTCMLFNNAVLEKCAACETPKPGSSAPPPQPAFKPTEFKKPASQTFSFGFKPAPPAVSKDDTPVAAPKPSQDAPTSNNGTQKQPSTSDGLFQFGSGTPNANPTNGTTGSSLFGSVAQSNTPAPAFGVPSLPSFGSTAPSLNFGSQQPAANVEKSSTPSLNFGSQQSSTTVEKSSTPSLNFGSQQPSTNGGLFQFGSGAPNANPTNGTTGSSLFGSIAQSNTPTSVPNFGAPSLPSFGSTTPSLNFGSQQPSTNGGLFQFGSGTSNANPTNGTTGSSLFGSAPQSNTSAPTFGAPSLPSFGSTTPSLNFGSQQPSTNGGLFQFGSGTPNANATNGTTGSLFGSTPLSTFPTTAPSLGAAPSLPSLGANLFAPASGSSMTSSRKLLQAKRKKRG